MAYIFKQPEQRMYANTPVASTAPDELTGVATDPNAATANETKGTGFKMLGNYLAGNPFEVQTMAASDAPNPAATSPLAMPQNPVDLATPPSTYQTFQPDQSFVSGFNPVVAGNGQNSSAPSGLTAGQQNYANTYNAYTPRATNTDFGGIGQAITGIVPGLIAGGAAAGLGALIGNMAGGSSGGTRLPTETGRPAGAQPSGGNSLIKTAGNVRSIYNGVNNVVDMFGGTSAANLADVAAANANGTGLDGLLSANGAYGTAAAGSNAANVAIANANGTGLDGLLGLNNAYGTGAAVTSAANLANVAAANAAGTGLDGFLALSNSYGTGAAALTEAATAAEIAGTIDATAGGAGLIIGDASAAATIGEIGGVAGADLAAMSAAGDAAATAELAAGMDAGLISSESLWAYAPYVAIAAVVLSTPWGQQATTKVGNAIEKGVTSISDSLSTAGEALLKGDIGKVAETVITAPLKLVEQVLDPGSWFGGGGGGGSVICTELVAQKKMPYRYYVQGTREFVKYSEQGKKGYYLWSNPTVKYLKKNPDTKLSRAISQVFNWRAEYIAARAGIKGAKRVWQGAVINTVMYATCWTLAHTVCYIPKLAELCNWRKNES